MSSMSYLAALGRIMMAAIFLASGFQKVLTPDQAQKVIASLNIPQPMIVFWIVVAVELLGGICLVIGLATRTAALALAAFTIAAAIGVHNNFADPQQFVQFMKNMAMAGGLLQVVAFGSGGLAVSRS